jgi:hypothetical protein
MLDVLIALAPAAICGIVYFLLDAFILEVTCVAFAVASEFVYFFIAKGGFNVRFANSETKQLAKKVAELKKAGQPYDEAASALKAKRAELRKAAFAKSRGVCISWVKQFDFTSVVTGLILALILPSTVKWYEAAIGSVAAIVFIKMLFGGTGRNIANPAAAGRLFMFISFAITTYTAANFGTVIEGSGETLTSGATYLSGALLIENPNLGAISLLDLFLGTGVAGCIGETCKLALIVGYIYLVVRRVIKWWQPLLYIVVTGLMAAALNADFAFFLPSILSGGVMFGGIFMFTDYVTSPKGVYAQIVYYVVAGILTAVLRHFTHIEVVSFVIVIMNLIVPLLDAYIRRKPFGYKREKKNKEVSD